MLVHPRAHLVERCAEDRECFVQFPAHTNALRTLAGEQERQPPAGDSPRWGPDGAAVGERGEAVQQLLPIGPDHHRAALQARARRQREADVGGVELRVGRDELRQPRGLRL